MDDSFKKAVFIDRDGTLNHDPNYLSRVEDFALLPGAAEAVRILNQDGWLVFVVTNQSGIARGFLSLEVLDAIHARLQAEVAELGGQFDGIFFCPHHPDDACDCRKPAAGMVRQALGAHAIDLNQSWVIGDSPSDIALGRAIGCRTALVAKNASGPCAEAEADVIAADLLAAVRVIREWESR